MATMTGGQALVQQLKLEGIDTIFGLPGVQLDWAFDAIYEERNHFRVIHTRHEQGTAYMADGYARSTGKVGMCLVVPGPGLLNASGALSTAYACSSPVLCVSGQIDSKLIGVGRGLLHEVKDQMQAIASVTKWQGRAMTPAEIPGLVHAAFSELHTGRPRPVEIEIPPDVLQAEGEVQLFEAAHFERPAGDPDLIEKAAALIGGAKTPLIMAGGGVLRAAAWDELKRLAEVLEAPVVMTQNGKGALSDHDYRAFNARAMGELATRSDAILAVGTRFLAGVNPRWERDAVKVVQLDIDPQELGRNYAPDIGIEADARAGLAALAERVERHNGRRPSRRDELSALQAYYIEEGNSVQPQAELAHALRAELPEDGLLFSESTQVGYWAQAYFPVYQPRTFFSSGYQGTLGYGFATAIGGQVGNPDKRVVSINGDGGFFYNVQELSTLAQQKIPLVTVVFNDNAYGNVKRIQEMRFGGRTIASDLYNPDLMKLADAYGMTGYRAHGAEELRRALRSALAANEPSLIEVPVEPMPPLGARQTSGPPPR
jgi:acetolactate synthase-1/2/3 large subunit